MELSSCQGAHNSKLHDEDGNNFTDPSAIVEAFSNTFASVYTPASFTHPNFDSDNNSLLGFVSLITKAVLNKIMAALHNIQLEMISYLAF